MPFFTVQLAYVAYYSREEIVEADSLAAALDKAIERANESDAWSSSDNCGNTFVEAVAEGDGVELWLDDKVKQLPVPSRFTEDGEGPRVTVTVSSGVVQHVEIKDGTARVEVRDYDTDGTSDADHIQTDKDGDRYCAADWSNLIPTDKAG
jgi:hypothetical protein